MTIGKHALIGAIRNLRSLLSQADDEAIDGAYQWAAGQAKGSDYAHTCEPMQGVCMVFQNEQRRRMLNAVNCTCDQPDEIQCDMHGPHE